MDSKQMMAWGEDQEQIRYLQRQLALTELKLAEAIEVAKNLQVELDKAIAHGKVLTAYLTAFIKGQKVSDYHTCVTCAACEKDKYGDS